MPNTDQFDPTDIAGQRRAKEAKSLASGVSRATEEEDFKWLMADEKGRRFMWRLLEQAGVFRTSFGATDAETNFREGQRNMGVRLVAQIHELCPEAYLLMIKEQKHYGRSTKPKSV